MCVTKSAHLKYFCKVAWFALNMIVNSQNNTTGVPKIPSEFICRALQQIVACNECMQKH
jgi:hypothetical protein